MLLDQVDLKAPEDQPKNLLFKPHIYVRSNAAGGHTLASASGLGLQLGPNFQLCLSFELFCHNTKRMVLSNGKITCLNNTFASDCISAF